MEQAEAEHGVKLSFAMGFPAADFPECGPVLCGHGPDAARVQTVVNQWADELLARRGEWKMQLYAPDAAVQEALLATILNLLIRQRAAGGWGGQGCAEGYNCFSGGDNCHSAPRLVVFGEWAISTMPIRNFLQRRQRLLHQR